MGRMDFAGAVLRKWISVKKGLTEGREDATIEIVLLEDPQDEN